MTLYIRHSDDAIKMFNAFERSVQEHNQAKFGDNGQQINEKPGGGTLCFPSLYFTKIARPK